MRSRAVEREAQRRAEPGYFAWHRARQGVCAICGESGLVFRHHVVLEQHVRTEHGDPWNRANSLDIGAWCEAGCHELHHSAAKRIPRSKIPPAAIDFAVELLGEARTSAYLARYYADC